MRRRLLAAAFGTIVAGVALAAAERWQRDNELGAVRVCFDPPGLKYVLSADPMTVERGWVEGAVPPPRRPGVPRIVCVGDSTTFGVGVATQETWCADVRRSLGKAEAYNFGMNGWDAEQVATLLEARVPAWEPDVVVWGAYINDVFPTYVLYGSQSGDPVFVGTRVPEGARLLPEKLALALLPHSALFRRLQGLAYVRSERNRKLPGSSTDWYGQQLDRIKAWSTRTGTPLVVLAISPHVLADPATCPSQVPDASLCEAGARQYQGMVTALERRGLGWVDGLSAFQASGKAHYHPPGRLDMDHPNAEGHAVLAAAVLPSVIEALSASNVTNPDTSIGPDRTPGVSGSHGSILQHE